MIEWNPVTPAGWIWRDKNIQEMLSCMEVCDSVRRRRPVPGASPYLPTAIALDYDYASECGRFRWAHQL